jgi:hypothetical protein
LLWDLSPNNRLKLTALASSVSSLYGGAAIDRAAAWPERYEGKRLLPEVPSFVRHGAPPSQHCINSNLFRELVAFPGIE